MDDETKISEFDDLVKKIEDEILEEAKKIYTERTLEEAYNPKNVGELKNPDAFARITGPCGDTMQIHLKVNEGKIVDSKFWINGCGVLMACGSVITELIKGKTIEKAFEIDDKDILSVLGGLLEDDLHCATLAVDTLKATIEDYHKSQKRL